MAEEIIGKADADLLPEWEAVALRAIKQQVLASGKGTCQNIRTAIAGKTALYDLTVEPLHDNAGAVIGITCAFLDTTGQQGEQWADAEKDGTSTAGNNGGNP